MKNSIKPLLLLYFHKAVKGSFILTLSPHSARKSLLLCTEKILDA